MPVDKQQQARILIVEDEPIIALTLQDLLAGAGFEIAGVAVKLATAFALIESGRCDAAILDANLAGVSASPVASALAARPAFYRAFRVFSRATSGCFSWSGFLPSEALPPRSGHSGSEHHFVQTMISLRIGQAQIANLQPLPLSSLPHAICNRRTVFQAFLDVELRPSI
jgi:hypothetical protein